MSVDIETNNPDLAKTSPSARRPEAAESETEYLSREIADSKEAFARTSQELQDNLRSCMDLSRWVRQYPWAALGVASVTGFTAAAAVTPKPGQSVGERLAELFDNHPPQAISPAAGEAASAPSKPEPSRQSRSILDSLFGLARLLIETFLVTAIRASASPPASDNSD